jgi:hypothetical protein
VGGHEPPGAAPSPPPVQPDMKTSPSPEPPKFEQPAAVTDLPPTLQSDLKTSPSPEPPEPPDGHTQLAAVTDLPPTLQSDLKTSPSPEPSKPMDGHEHPAETLRLPPIGARISQMGLPCFCLPNHPELDAILCELVYSTVLLPGGYFTFLSDIDAEMKSRLSHSPF